MTYTPPAPPGRRRRPARHRTTTAGAVLAALAAFVLVIGLPAVADHTNPDEGLSQPTAPEPITPMTGFSPPENEAEWTGIAHFASNPGTDLDFFMGADGGTYSTSGTLGGGPEQHVGQRILRLVDPDGTVNPTWVADHGSSHCDNIEQAGSLGLQHDVQVTPANHPLFQFDAHHETLGVDREDVRPELILDATDATQRCHDPDGGGIEILDVSGIGAGTDNQFREIHLTRHDGTVHNQTVDATRPWIAYTSHSDGLRPWIDVLDMRTCLTEAAGGTLPAGADLATKRAECRPLVYRMPFEPTWTAQKLPPEAGEGAGNLNAPYGCHDITATPGRILCAAIFGTAVFDVSNLTDADGNVRGDPLPCPVVEPSADLAGEGVMVTNCDLGAGGDSANADQVAYDALEVPGTDLRPEAKGWELMSPINHPGALAPGQPFGVSGSTLNNNPHTASDEGVAISHEADVTPDGRWLFVTDERGGGVVPPGSSCSPGLDNPIGNGGMHVYDLSDPKNPAYALNTDGEKAVFISNSIGGDATFCNIHVIEQIPGEQRLVMAWYDQGVKVIDYEIDDQGRWSFTERGAYRIEGANTWTAAVFHIEANDDGTNTYYVMASDIQRGIDVYSFTLEPAKPVTTEITPPSGDVNDVGRLGGQDRILTSIELSERAFLPAGTPDEPRAAGAAILARADQYPDALAGAGLANEVNAPVLLTHRDQLHPDVATELARLKGEATEFTVYLLGGEEALTPAVLQALESAGFTVERVGGVDRFETAAFILDEIRALGGAVSAVTIARADDFADALSAGNLAGRRVPVLLSLRDALPKATVDALKRNDTEAGAPTGVYLAGGPAALSTDVENALTVVYDVTRLGGEERYETSVLLLQEARRLGADVTTMILASGRNWPDALAAAPAARVLNGLPFSGTTLLIDPTDLDLGAASGAFLAGNPERVNTAYIAGLTEAVAGTVDAQVEAAITQD